MLASERKERPSAVQVLDAVRLTFAFDFCSCETSHATSDNRFSQPENDEEIVSKISPRSELTRSFPCGGVGPIYKQKTDDWSISLQTKYPKSELNTRKKVWCV